MVAALSERVLARMAVNASKAKLARIEAREHYKNHGTEAERKAVDFAERWYGWQDVAKMAGVSDATAQLIVLGVIKK
jgi:hypothetical protein